MQSYLRVHWKVRSLIHFRRKVWDRIYLVVVSRLFSSEISVLFHSATFSDKTHNSEGLGVKQIIICCLMKLCVTIRIQFSCDVHSDLAYACTQLESLVAMIVFIKCIFLKSFSKCQWKKTKKKKRLYWWRIVQNQL